MLKYDHAFFCFPKAIPRPVGTHHGASATTRNTPRFSKNDAVRTRADAPWCVDGEGRGKCRGKKGYLPQTPTEAFF
jgi:hypothetical protein